MIFTPGVEEERTAWAFQFPAAGQRFSEMYSFWMYVVAVGEDGSVTTREGSPPITFPEEAALKRYPSAQAWREHFAYKSIPGYSVRYHDIQNVRGWEQPND